MKKWLNGGFSEPLWERDTARLEGHHRELAQAIFRYATESLGSEPFQRESSLRGRSDGQTIFRTTLHRSFWLVLDTRTGGLLLHFPDKEDVIESTGLFTVQRAAATQWTRKKEKQVRIPPGFSPEQTQECLALVDRIHDAAVEYYSRGKDYSVTLGILMGEPTGGTPLLTPEADAFAALLGNSPRCLVCRSQVRLSLHRSGGGWELYCDEHHPNRSQWIALGAEQIPFEVKKLVWHRDGGRCVVCGSEQYATFDHMIPANRGGGAFSGSHLETNIRLKCRTCNYSKGNKLIP